MHPRARASESTTLRGYVLGKALTACGCATPAAQKMKKDWVHRLRSAGVGIRRHGRLGPAPESQRVVQQGDQIGPTSHELVEVVRIEDAQERLLGTLERSL